MEEQEPVSYPDQSRLRERGIQGAWVRVREGE